MNKFLVYRTLFGLVLILVFILSGCQTDSPPTPTPLVPTVSSSLVESPLSPILNSRAESPVPTPIPRGTALPTPAADVGSVTGTLIWLLKGNSIAADTTYLYLGPLVESDDGTPRLASLDKEQDPMTISDKFGRFAFQNVKPGTYTLIYSLPGHGERLLTKKGMTGDFLIVVEAGKITDLDQFTVDYPLQ